MGIRKGSTVRTCAVTGCLHSDHTLVVWELEKCRLHPTKIRMLCGCPKPYTFYSVKLPEHKYKNYGVEHHDKRNTTICSLHFNDGKPTKANPYPNEIITAKEKEEPNTQTAHTTAKKTETHSSATSVLVSRKTKKSKRAKMLLKKAGPGVKNSLRIRPRPVLGSPESKSNNDELISKEDDAKTKKSVKNPVLKKSLRRVGLRFRAKSNPDSTSKAPSNDEEEIKEKKKRDITPTKKKLTKAGKRAGLRIKPISKSAQPEADREPKPKVEEVTGPGIKTHCLICSNSEIQVLQRRSFYTSGNSDDPRVTAWTTSLAISVQEELRLDLSSTFMLMSASYCPNCYERLCDISFLRKSVVALQERLDKTVSAVESSLMENFSLAQGVAEFCSKAAPVTAYSHALRHIGMQVQARLDRKNKPPESPSEVEKINHPPVPKVEFTRTLGKTTRNVAKKKTGGSHLITKSYSSQGAEREVVVISSPEAKVQHKKQVIRNVAKKKTGGSVHLIRKSDTSADCIELDSISCSSIQPKPQPKNLEPQKMGTPVKKRKPKGLEFCERQPPTIALPTLLRNVQMNTMNSSDADVIPIAPATQSNIIMNSYPVPRTDPFLQAAKKLGILAAGGDLNVHNLGPYGNAILPEAKRPRILSATTPTLSFRPATSTSSSYNLPAFVSQPVARPRKSSHAVRPLSDLEIEVIDISDPECSRPATPKPKEVTALPSSPSLTVPVDVTVEVASALEAVSSKTNSSVSRSTSSANISMSKPAPAFRLSAIELKKYFGCSHCPGVFPTIEKKKAHEVTHHDQAQGGSAAEDDSSTATSAKRAKLTMSTM